MHWESRQNRLRGLFGQNSHLCFHVLALYSPFQLTIEKLNRLADEHEFNLNEQGPFTLPDFKFGGHTFRGGEILKTQFTNNDGMPKFFIQINETQLVYSAMITSDIDMTDAAQETSGVLYDNLWTVATQYETAFREAFPTAKIPHPLLIQEHKDSFELKFRYVLQPYSPSLCHPNDLGMLRPITVIEGIEIHPKIQRINHLHQTPRPPMA